ncbi:NADH--cytochrome b5 reductase 1 [Morella rubra]|uniref:NADH--cytochrome b5 reductase 1 n=1 Tax=Morella rubra TaxID=262757 RepID=A0A6A1WNT2_9ROSI|nr:NADH--cytochrome b5 reductase 1 [Morella rubra]
MEFMPTPYYQLLGIAVTLAGVGMAAAYLYYRKKPKGCLNPEKFIEFKLVKKTQLSPNTARFRFALPTPTSVLGLPVGHHMYPSGRMSHHFREMREGDYLPVMGPKGSFKYKPGQVRAFGMLAGGFGINPMFALIRAILENPKDKTNLHLIYACVSLEEMSLKPPTAWNGGTGFITKEMIQTHCPAPAPDIQILRCGPPAMNKAMEAHLNALGYTSDMQFEF